MIDKRSLHLSQTLAGEDKLLRLGVIESGKVAVEAGTHHMVCGRKKHVPNEAAQLVHRERRKLLLFHVFVHERKPLVHVPAAA